jgi:DNA-binding NarL/FixJ family response regulator
MSDEPKLTDREMQVRGLIMRGMVHKEIAAELGLSVRTVKHHACTLYKKYGVRSRARLVALLAGHASSVRGEKNR